MSDLARVEPRDRGQFFVVAIIGEVDLSNARDVMDSVAAALPDDTPRVVLDLTEVRYFDSAGIAALFQLAERLGHRRRELRLVAPLGSRARAVLELTNTGRVIPLHGSVADLPESW